MRRAEGRTLEELVGRVIGEKGELSGIRPIEPVLDMRGVVRLIEEGFGTELNPMAQETLRDMRRLSRMGWLLGPVLWMSAFEGLYSGFVWTEGRRVVGNVTVSECRGGGPGCWLVSNLVVDPAYRRRGIGRALVKKGLAHILSQNGRRVILQVRGDNRAAVHLYCEMGFAAVDTLLEMRLPGPWPAQPEAGEGDRSRYLLSGGQPPAGLPLRWRHHDEWYDEYLLSREAVPAGAQRVHPVECRSFRPTWDKRILRWFGNWCGSAREFRLGIEEKGKLSATLTVWAARRRPYHRLEIMVHPDHRGKWEGGLVDRALDLLYPYPRHPVCVEAYAAHQELVKALESRGFVIDWELVQMELDLTKRSPGRPDTGGGAGYGCAWPAGAGVARWASCGEGQDGSNGAD